MAGNEFEALNKVIDKRERAKKRQDALEAKREALAAKKRFNDYEREQAATSKKLSIIKSLQAWGQRFSKSKQMERLADCSPLGFEIEIYGSGWGHEGHINNDLGCWSRVTIDSLGFLEYRSGYKYFGEHPKSSICIGDPHALCLEYLERLQKHISSGKVIGFIAKHLDKSSKK